MDIYIGYYRNDSSYRPSTTTKTYLEMVDGEYKDLNSGRVWPVEEKPVSDVDDRNGKFYYDKVRKATNYECLQYFLFVVEESKKYEKSLENAVEHHRTEMEKNKALLEEEREEISKTESKIAFYAARIVEELGKEK
jgi:hypothetical protein